MRNYHFGRFTIFSSIWPRYFNRPGSSGVKGSSNRKLETINHTNDSILKASTSELTVVVLLNGPWFHAHSVCCLLCVHHIRHLYYLYPWAPGPLVLTLVFNQCCAQACKFCFSIWDGGFSHIVASDIRM
jgi:hypothetical protein